MIWEEFSETILLYTSTVSSIKDCSKILQLKFLRSWTDKISVETSWNLKKSFLIRIHINYKKTKQVLSIDILIRQIVRLCLSLLLCVSVLHVLLLPIHNTDGWRHEKAFEAFMSVHKSLKNRGLKDGVIFIDLFSKK